MIKGESVCVLRFVETGKDGMGEPVQEWQSETVEDVLFSPSSTADGSVERPNGDTLIVTFHFPKTYTQSLRGCRIEYAGNTYSVQGDPQAYMIDNCPTQWNRTVTAQVYYG
jgi:hypothetical protein